MRCPYCASENTQVKDSRPTEESAAIRRRRVCPDCGGRFTTFERVQLRELIVVKRSGRRVPFDRDKLARSVEIALRKRPVEPERVERMVSGIVRQLESMGESEIASSAIGELVMEGVAMASIRWPMCASPRSTATSARRPISTRCSARSPGHRLARLSDDDDQNEGPAAKTAVDYKQCMR